jgi:tRNA(Arg) A34 adenosine deaminase TadA
VVARRVELTLPDWLGAGVDPSPVLATRAERMRYVVDLARKNVEHGTGGPFAAAVVAVRTGEVCSVGVNLVVTGRNATAHAEMVAVQLADTALGRHDLSAAPGGPFELVSSAEPCTMCLGAVIWSGVHALVCGARDADARAIGFDEGPKPADWVTALRTRHVEVERDLLRDDAVAVLRAYAAAGGPIYNASR